MFPPGEIFTDGNSQVLAAVNYFQCVSMDLIVGIDFPVSRASAICQKYFQLLMAVKEGEI